MKKYTLYFLSIILLINSFSVVAMLRHVESVNDLPDEIIKYRVFEYLDAQTLLNMREVNKKFKKFVSEGFDLLSECNSVCSPSFLRENISLITQSFVGDQQLQALEEKLVNNQQKKVILKKYDRSLHIVDKGSVIEYFSDILSERVRHVQKRFYNRHIKNKRVIWFFPAIFPITILLMLYQQHKISVGLLIFILLSCTIFVGKIFDWLEYREESELQRQKRAIELSVFRKNDDN